MPRTIDPWLQARDTLALRVERLEAERDALREALRNIAHTDDAAQARQLARLALERPE